MKKKFLTLIAVFLISTSFSQTNHHDTIIVNKAYTTVYSFDLKAPLIVYYKLYKGGGDCSRAKFSFKTEHIKTANDKDYEKNGYDKGHLADAEDFAYNCELEELTFRYWNCYPQTPELNRGIWKSVETKVRNISETDSIIILCGGFYNNQKIGNGVSIPDTCWKIVYNISIKSYIISYVFTNTEKPISNSMDVKNLNAILNKRYGIDIFLIVNKMIGAKK